MTNKRITELTALDGDDVADNDVLAIVDVSDTTMAASGTTKKITVAELVTDSALTNKFWPNSTTALTGANLANGDKLAVVDVGSPDVAKYITADELAQGSQFSSRYRPIAPTWTAWTPTVTPDTGSITSYTVGACAYLIEGKVGHFHGRISITDAGTGAGGLSITLPSGVSYAGYDAPSWVGGWFDGNGTVSGAVLASGSILYCIKNDGTTGIGTGSSFRFTVVCRVA
jgi:hypothetical protein